MRLVGIDLHVSHVDMKTFRICPQCVAEHGRHEAFWHLRMVHWCPIHRAPLLATCRACGVGLRWTRPGIGRCNCGADLTKQTSKDRCSEPLANLLLVVRAALYSDAQTSAARPQALAHLFHLDLYRLMRLLETLEGVVLRPTRHSALGKPPVKCDGVTKVASILCDWPRAFQQFLEDQYGKELENDSSRRAFKITFPWAFWTLGRNLKAHADQLQFLRDEVIRFGACYWTREQLTRVTPKVALIRVSYEWGSIPEAASVMGIDPRTLLNRVREGLIPIKETGAHRKSRNYRVDMRWARSCNPPVEGVPMRDAAKELGISTPLLSALRTQKVYQDNAITRRLHGYAMEDIADFKERLDRVIALHSGDGSIGGIMIDGRRFDSIGPSAIRAKILRRLIEPEKALAVKARRRQTQGGAPGRARTGTSRLSGADGI